jgi:hypothetical protein
MPYGVLLLGAKQTGSAAPVLAGRHVHCTRLSRRSPGATTAPEGEDHVKAQASLGCNRNVIRTLVQLAACLGMRQRRVEEWFRYGRFLRFAATREVS